MVWSAPTNQTQALVVHSAKLLAVFCVVWVAVQAALVTVGLPSLGWLLPLGLIAFILFLGGPRRSTLRAILLCGVLSLLACLFLCVPAFSRRHYAELITFLLQSGVSATVVGWSLWLLKNLRDEHDRADVGVDAAKIGKTMGRSVRRWLGS